MVKVTVLGLSGCRWCRALTGELDELAIPYSFVDVADDDALADHMEALLETKQYPMVVLSDNQQALYYVHRPDSATNLGLSKAFDGGYRIGCQTLDSILENIQNVLNKY